MAPTITIAIPAYTVDRLMTEHDRNLALITAIKKDVGQDYDNISKPVPLFEQLESA